MTTIAALPRKRSLLTFLCLLFLLCVGTHPAIGQQAQTQPASTAQTVPLTQLYWFFLSYQLHLDNLAAQLESGGQDGSPLRNALQKQLQFSDADFARILESAERLVKEVKELDAQAAAINAAGASPTRHAQLTELTQERESAINDEIDNLARALSPEKKAALDAFLPRFFHVAAAPVAAAPSAGVQQ